MLLYSFACCSIYLLLYRFSCKMSKLFSKVVSKLPAEANVKSRRKTDEKNLENNRAKTFHFYFPSTGKHHSIGLKDRCWPEDLSLADRLKFAASGESNKKMPLRFSEGTFEAKFIGVTETEDAETRVLTQVENKIDAASGSQIVDLTFSEIQVSTPDKFDGQKSISQSASSRHKDIESFFTSKRKRTASSQPAPKGVRLESDESFNLSDNDEPGLSEKEKEDEPQEDEPQNDERQEDEPKEDELNDKENEPIVECHPGQSSATDNDGSLVVTLRNVCETLKLVTEALSIQRRDSRNIRKLLSSGAPIESASETPGATEAERIVVDGVILNQLPGSTPGKYGINLFKHLFTLDERIKGIAQPEKATKAALDPQKMAQIQKMVENRFPGQWSLARKSINDCARDSKKVKKRILANEKRDSQTGNADLIINEMDETLPNLEVSEATSENNTNDD